MIYQTNGRLLKSGKLAVRLRAKIEVIRPAPANEEPSPVFAPARFPESPRSISRADAFAAVERRGPELGAVEAAATLAGPPYFHVPGFRSNPSTP